MATFPRLPRPSARKPRGRHAHPYSKAMEVALEDRSHVPTHRGCDERRVA